MTLVLALVSLVVGAEPRGLTARSALVMDLDSGAVLFRHGPQTARPIASISKLMAMRVVLQVGIDADARTAIVDADVPATRGGARSRLRPGRAYSNSDLLHAALLGSDNRAVLALGRAAGMSRAALTKAMNREATSLGLRTARFAEPTGISHANVMSPPDLVKLLRAALDVPELAAISRKPVYTTSKGTPSGPRLTYSNTNAFAHAAHHGVLVGKTGFNSAAGWCLAVVKTVHGRRVAFVVLGAKSKGSRIADVRRLEAWIFR